ncbi:MAG: D-alanine--D-alanine ligase [Actinomycetota bacterium]
MTTTARVAVVAGGRSLEREISLRSGHNVAAALRHLGHDVKEVDVTADLIRSLEAADVAFIALHGRDGEDGTIQLACEALGISYTGSPPLSCRCCFDKGLAKGLLHKAGLPTPPGYVISAEAVRHMGAGAALRRAAERLGFPLVVKPAAQGSALGLTVVEDQTELSAAAMAAFDYGDRTLFERFVDGTEVAVAVAGPALETLPGVEIRTRSGVFDFEARVSPGAVEFVCPTDAADERAVAVAREAARALGVRDFGRVDLRINVDGPMVLDVKTCPGLTETSIVPLAAERAGIGFTDLVSRVVTAALDRAPTVRS